MTTSILIAKTTQRIAVTLCIALVAVWSTFEVRAQLKLDITESTQGGIPIFVASFTNEQAGARNYSGIISADLESSGLFHVVRKSHLSTLALPNSKDSYDIWINNGIEKIVAGEIKTEAGAKTLIVHLFDVVTRRKINSWRSKITNNIAGVSHELADLVYQELTGTPGIFSSRLIFVSSEKTGPRSRRYHLNISDADGYNIVSILDSDYLLISPTWAPDTRRIAYVQYDDSSSKVFIQELASGTRKPLFLKGAKVSSIDWSSDGNQIAYAATDNDNSDIFIYDLKTQAVKRLTTSKAIDTEPNFAKDGSLYFTSNRSGSPQIYRIDSGQQLTQVTSAGSYNADPDLSPRGDKLAYVSARSGQFAIIIRDLNSGDEQVLSDGSANERPRFAPNGQLLSYLRQDGGRSTLGFVTIDGAYGKLIPLKASFVRSVSWSPLVP